jgi:hypothetical protein
MLHAGRVVNTQHLNRRPPLGRQAPQSGAIPREMVFPAVDSRIEENHQGVSGWIITGGVRPLGAVAVSTSQASVPKRRQAAMLSRPNVIHFVRQNRICLRELTVLVLSAGACPDLLAAELGHSLRRRAIRSHRQFGLRVQKIGIGQRGDIAQAERVRRRK